MNDLSLAGRCRKYICYCINNLIIYARSYWFDLTINDGQTTILNPINKCNSFLYSECSFYCLNTFIEFGIWRGLECRKYRLDPDAYPDDAHTISTKNGSVFVNSSQKFYTNEEYCIERIRFDDLKVSHCITFLPLLPSSSTNVLPSSFTHFFALIPR